MGRINSSQGMEDRKGLNGRVRLGGKELKGWKARMMPIDPDGEKVPGVTSRRGAGTDGLDTSRREVTPGTSPALYCGTLTVPSPPSSPSPTFSTFASFPADTFLDMTTWTKGIVCVYYLALVNADGCDGFTISGEGVIDRHGAGIWEEFWAKPCGSARAKASISN